MTPSDLDAIRARERAASPGPWWWSDRADASSENLGAFVDANGNEVCNFGNGEQYYPTEGEEPSAADGEFIASARSDIPLLLAEVDRLRAALEAAKTLHAETCGARPGRFTATGAHPEQCECGADAHNAAIARALRGEP